MTGYTNLIIEQTPKTPHIDLNKFTGDLIFSGRSTPEDASFIFEPVLKWTERYVHDPRPITNVRVNLDILNTTTALWLSRILRLLSSIESPDHTLTLHLYLSQEEYEAVKNFDDIRDAFIPIADVLHGDVHNLCIRLYSKNQKDEITATKLILIENDQYVHAEIH